MGPACCLTNEKKRGVLESAQGGQNVHEEGDDDAIEEVDEEGTDQGHHEVSLGRPMAKLS